MSDLFRQAILLCDLPVTGWYRYNDTFQIIPAPDGLKRPTAIVGHHPPIFQWRYPASKESRTLAGQSLPQWLLDNESAAEKARELILILGVFLAHRVFEYRGATKNWYLNLGDTSKPAIEPQWGQKGYSTSDFNSSIKAFSVVDGIGEFDEMEIDAYFNRRYIAGYDAVLDVPQNLTTLLDGFFGLSAEDKKAFLSSCTLFEQGIEAWDMYPSLSFIGFVSCLETLISADHRGCQVETCKECGQDRHRVTRKFRDFFQKYGNESKEFKKYAMKIYKYRSQVVHSGELFHGEVMPEKFGGEERVDIDDFRRSVIRTCRICMVNWIDARLIPHPSQKNDR